MKFKFRLKRVLEVRLREEAQAQVQFQSAKALTLQALKQLEDMYNAIDESRTFAAKQVQNQTAQSQSFLVSADDFAKLQNIRIQRQREVIRSLKQEEERLQDILMQKMVDRKAIEKLREKALAEFKERVSRAEDRTIDEINTTRFGRGFGLIPSDRDL